MDKNYSKIYSYDYSENMKNQLFRYNYKTHNLEKVCIPSKEMLEDIKSDLNSKIDWMRAEAQAALKAYEETGYMVICAEGLSEESWKEDREYYMDRMCDNVAYEMLAALDEFVPDMKEEKTEAISEEEIDRLVKAGDWHIDEDGHQWFAMADDPRLTGDLGYVSFGNYIYDLRCLDVAPDTDKFAVDICEMRPVNDIGQLAIKSFQDGLPYTFEAIDVDDLEEKYLPGMSAYVIMERNDFNSNSLENFKRDVVKALATGGFDHQKPLISAKYTAVYEIIKDNGGFPQFYERQKKRLEHLEEYERDPHKLFSFLPKDTKQLISMDKLSPEQIDTLASYYEHFRESYQNNCLDYTANKRMLIRKMVDDGLDDSKIGMINDSIYERFEKFRVSVPKPYFKKIVSDLIKEIRSVNAARTANNARIQK